MSRIARMTSLTVAAAAAVLTLVTSCRIEPPLHLPMEPVTMRLPLVITELEVIWDADTTWRDEWWYGWDAEDVRRWGTLEYPDPTYFELRRFYQGMTPSYTHSLVERTTIFGKTFRRMYDYGYYDMLFWSNIDSPTGTQTVLINEDNYEAVLATTTRASSMARRQPAAKVPLRNQPDIFYTGYERDIHISTDLSDYDYYDPIEGVWMKKIRAALDPVVYIYLVQVVIYNNSGRIRGLVGDAVLTGLSEGVILNTGRTLDSNVDVAFDMRMKQDLAARRGRHADILGAMLTTYGMCGMEPWRVSRGDIYTGTRTDLDNVVQLDFLFSNSMDKLFEYDLTDQMRRHPHGGVLTIEIDADTITIPVSDQPSGGFNPTIEDPDSLEYEFPL